MAVPDMEPNSGRHYAGHRAVSQCRADSSRDLCGIIVAVTEEYPATTNESRAHIDYHAPTPTLGIPKLTMNDSEFNQQVDTVLLRIEEQVEILAEQLEEDMDWESGLGMLKLDFPRGKLIFSRQSAVHQLWLAAPDTGYHCNWDGKEWRCDKSAETLTSLLARYSLQLCGKTVQI